MNGYIVYRVISGFYIMERFLQFVAECVLPLCVRDYYIIMLDNVKTYRNEVSFFFGFYIANFILVLQTMCDAAGVRLEYLPPYSFDLHPIEMNFVYLKIWM